MPETPVTPNAAYKAVPTVKVDGQLNDRVTEQLLAMEMRECEGGMSSVELRFSNRGTFAGSVADFAFEDGAVLKLGAELTIGAGDVDSPTEIFRGKITGLEETFPADGAAELVVLAEDSLQAARMNQRSKTWENVSLADVVRQVASNLGLTPVVDGLDQNIGTQQQFNESDLRFLRRLLARYDADLQIVGSNLNASPRAQAQRNTLELDIEGELRSVRVLADLSHQVSQVTVTGWDYQQGKAISATSQKTGLGAASGKNGTDWLQQALAQRSLQLAQFASLDKGEAQALADAEYSQRARRFVVAHGVAQGNPTLRVGSYLSLKGLGPRFSNTYYTTSTTHRFDTNSGYQTEFAAECAYLGGAS